MTKSLISLLIFSAPPYSFITSVIFLSPFLSPFLSLSISLSVSSSLLVSPFLSFSLARSHRVSLIFHLSPSPILLAIIAVGFQLSALSSQLSTLSSQLSALIDLLGLSGLMENNGLVSTSMVICWHALNPGMISITIQIEGLKST